MPFYLTNSIGKKVLISNEYLKSKLLTYSTESNELARIFEKSRSGSFTSDELFFKKVGYKIDEISVDDCVEIILNNSSLSDELISSLLVLDSNTFLTIVYCLKEGILTSYEIEDIMGMGSSKNRTERLISAIESVNKELDIFENFRSITGKLANHDIVSFSNTVNEIIDKKSQAANIFPKSETASLCFPMKAGLSDKDDFGLLEHTRWNFFNDHSYKGEKPRELTLDDYNLKWYDYLNLVYIAALLLWIECYNDAAEDYYNNLVNEGIRLNAEQKNLQDSFFKLMEKSYNGNISGRISADKLSVGEDCINYNTHTVLKNFINMALPELGKYLFEKRSMTGEVEKLSSRKLDNLLSEYLRIAGSHEANSALDKTKGSPNRDPQSNQFCFRDSTRKIFIPTFFNVLYRTYKDFKKDVDNSNMFETFDYARNSALLPENFLDVSDNSIGNLSPSEVKLISDFNYNYLWIYNPATSEFEGTEPLVCSKEEYVSMAKTTQHKIIRVDEPNKKTFYLVKNKRAEEIDEENVYFGFNNPFFYYTYNTHKDGEEEEVALDKIIQVSLQKVLSRPFVDCNERDTGSVFSFGDNSLIPNYLMFINEKTPEIGNRRNEAKELLKFAIHVSDEKAYVEGHPEMRLDNTGLYSVAEEMNALLKSFPEMMLNSLDSESERQEEIRTLRKQKASFIMSKLQSDEISTSSIVKWVLVSELADSYFNFLLNNSAAYGTVWHPTVSFDFYKFYRIELTNKLIITEFKSSLESLLSLKGREYENFTKYLADIKLEGGR